jgi:uncharacterized protein (TIGR02145 family)
MLIIMHISRISRYIIFIVLLLFLVISVNCTKNKEYSLQDVELKTFPPGTITQSRALVGYEIIRGPVHQNGDASKMIFYGVCWSTFPKPTKDSNMVYWGSEVDGKFLVWTTCLSPNTTYYARAFAEKYGKAVYGNEVSFKTPIGTEGQITDIDGNVYNTVIIGEQVWLAEDLKTTSYLTGDPIPYVQGDEDWDSLTTGAYCFYDNADSNGSIYGNIYNWYAVNDPRGIAPEGWHVATDEDWFTLVSFLTENDGFFITDLLKEDGEEHWKKNASFVCLNETGFTALPGGFRSDEGFINMGLMGYWWTSSIYYPGYPYYWIIGHSLTRKNHKKSVGCYVRCVKD